MSLFDFFKASSKSSSDASSDASSTSSVPEDKIKLVQSISASIFLSLKDVMDSTLEQLLMDNQDELGIGSSADISRYSISANGRTLNSKLTVAELLDLGYIKGGETLRANATSDSKAQPA